MGIYIKGMEMPKEAGKYRIEFDQCGNPYLLSDKGDGGIWHIIPVPPHGRLFDFDALLDNAKKRMQDEGLSNEEISVNMEFLEWCFTNEHNRLYAPTVIPASEEGE